MPSPDDLNLARRVVAQGICQRNEVEECLTIQHQSEQDGKLAQLGELLVERGYLTRSQLARIAPSGLAAPGAAGPGSLRLGPYELLLKIGEGGMGAVYKANDTRNGKIVAIKVLPRSKARDETFLKRFEMEARATFELDHPNIVHGYDIGHSDGYHYLVIEFVQGYDLCGLLEQRGRFTESEALAILEQMAKALDHIHTEHMIHRDIKPENILIGENGTAKLSDMGLTIDDPAHGRRRRLTEAGIAMGTPFYLSPEQIKGESEVDIRSDLYALGATTYEMITGRPPFEGETPAVVMLKHLNEYVPSPHDLDRTISINFCHLLERMMAKDPFHRYQTPYEMLQDIRRVMRGKAPMGIRPPAGRSSVARPELRPHSQRVDPIVARVGVGSKASSDLIPAVSRRDDTRQPPTSNVLPVVAKSEPGTSPTSGVLPVAAGSETRRAPSSRVLPAVTGTPPPPPPPKPPPSSKPAPAQSGNKLPAPTAPEESPAQPQPASKIPRPAPSSSKAAAPAPTRTKSTDAAPKPASAAAPSASGARPAIARKSQPPPVPKPTGLPLWMLILIVAAIVAIAGLLFYRFV